MPYISQKAREELADGREIDGVGELTYALYTLCVDTLPFSPRFADYAAILGALEATKLEIARSHLGPYERTKRAENGKIRENQE